MLKNPIPTTKTAIMTKTATATEVTRNSLSLGFSDKLNDDFRGFLNIPHSVIIREMFGKCDFFPESFTFLTGGFLTGLFFFGSFLIFLNFILLWPLTNN